MRQQTAVVTDSLACLTPALVEEYHITVVPLSFILKGKIYRDWVDITPSQAYKLFLEDPGSFQSSAPSPTDFLNAFRIIHSDVQNIICVTISNILSATYSAALIAQKQAELEFPQTKIEVLDSRTTTAAEGFIVLAAARAAAAYKDLDYIIKESEKVREKVAIVAILDTIRHVYRSGRIPKIASQIGSMLNVRPILYINTTDGGTVHFEGIVRSRQHGIARILKMMREKVENTPVRVAVMHAYAPEAALQLKETIAASFNCTEIWITEFSPLMGYATGTGALGLAFYRAD